MSAFLSIMVRGALGNREKQRLVCIVGVILLTVTIIVFLPVLRCGFLNYDDEIYITDNPNVQAGLTFKGIKWAFTSIRAGNWHPLTWISHMLDCQVYGLNPAGHHFTNLVIHTANVLLLFLLLFKITGFLWRSAFVAALFAVHPLHVESVAWIAERKDVLSTLFGILTTWAYVQYVKSPRIATYVFVVIFFALGLMSKPMLVTLPFLFLLLDYWPIGRFAFDGRSFRVAPSGKLKKILAEKLPLFGLSLLSCAITYFAQSAGGAVASFERMTLGVRAANALVAYTCYMLKMLYPVKLAVLYPHPGSTLPIWNWLGSALLLVAFTLLVVRGSRNKPYLAVGWLWYIGTMVPVIGLVQIGIQAMADRYTYVPLIGLFIIIAWGTPDLIQSLLKARSSKEKASIYSPSLFLIVPAVVILVVLAWGARVQIGYWKDSITLFQRALAVTKGNYLAHQNLGVALFHQGKLDAAANEFRAALKLKPSYAPAHNGLGAVLMCQGRYNKAVKHFSAAIRFDPRLEDARNNMAFIMEKWGRNDEAIAHYEAVLRINPDNADAHNNLGLVLAKLGRFDEAAAHFSNALKLKPNDAEIHCNLGSAFVKLGRFDEAVRHLSVAVKINPQLIEAHYNLGNAMVSLGELDKAVEEYRNVLQIKPNHIPARNNIAAVLYLQGKYSEAWKEIQKCQSYGGTPNLELIRLLSSKAPRPR